MNSRSPISLHITFSHIRALLYIGVLMAIVIVGIHHFAGVLSWYWIYKWFDIMMHILGGVLVGYFSIYMMIFMTYICSTYTDLCTGNSTTTSFNSDDRAVVTKHVVVGTYSMSRFIGVSVIGGLVIGVLWELLEYSYGLSGLGPERRLDTIADIINDVIGAIGISLCLYVYYKNRYRAVSEK